MKLAVILMALILAYLFGGAIPLAEETQNSIFSAPFFILLVGAFAVDMVIVCLKAGFHRSKICFQFMHMGIAIILVGVFIGVLGAKTSTFYIPIDASQSFDQVPNGDSYFDLGFDLSVEDFTVKKYPPGYALYRIETSAEEASYVDEALQENGNYDFGKYGIYPASDLMDDSGYTDTKYLDGGLLLKKQEAADQSYDAALVFTVNGAGSVRKSLKVNHPVSYAGWKFYLLSYDKENGEYIVLQAKKDFGVPVVMFGIGLTVIAAFGHCVLFAKAKKQKTTMVDIDTPLKN